MFPSLEVKVWSPMACYTRPESKVERVSYPVPTPSAARGVLEAIFWKPEFSWRVREIVVLKPVRYLSILRNEVEVKAGSGEGISITNSRQQRHTLALRDVSYIIRADIVLRSHADADIAKYREQFRRHVEQGPMLPKAVSRLPGVCRRFCISGRHGAAYRRQPRPRLNAL